MKTYFVNRLVEARNSKCVWRFVVVFIDTHVYVHLVYFFHFSYLASFKSRSVLPFWYRRTQVVPERGRYNGVVIILYKNLCFTTMSMVVTVSSTSLAVVKVENLR